jgi:hypothetical protein
LASEVDDETFDATMISAEVPADWRHRRRLGITQLDPALRFVDVSAAESLNHLRQALAPLALSLGLRDIDLSTVTSSTRRLTQEMARYVYDQRDAAGTPLYAGLRYVSRLNATWECWAIFHDRLRHNQQPSQSILPNDSGLIEAARVFGLAVPQSF